MKRFRFHLQALLDIRKRKEDSVKQELAKQNRLILEGKKELQQIHREFTKLQSSEKETRPKADNIMMLRYSVAYRHKLKQDLLKKGRQIDDLNADAAKIRKKLVEATKERRALEIIRERRFAEWKEEYKAQEQGFIDDISQQGFIRKSRSATDTVQSR